MPVVELPVRGAEAPVPGVFRIPTSFGLFAQRNQPLDSVVGLIVPHHKTYYFLRRTLA